jgi:hypothetical protein
LYYLASDSLEGREAGRDGGKLAAEYIVEKFKEIGLENFNGEYFQRFPLHSSYGNNIIGYIEGTDSILKKEYILLGAHYDHVGWNENNGKKSVFNGADDNASGTTGIIEIARKLKNNQNLLKRSILIIAFDAEEMGLIGSSYFVKHPMVDLSNIKCMLSCDMIGALNKGKELVFSGCESFDGGTDYLNRTPKVAELPVNYIKYSSQWKDRTDTSPFYDSDIPSIYVSTGLESPYHKPEDDADLIDYEGLQKSTEQIYNTVIMLSEKENYKFRLTHEWLGGNKSDFKIGLKVALNSNQQIYSKSAFNTKSFWGFEGGIFSQIKLSSNFSLQPELLFNKFRSPSNSGDISINSIELPLYINFMSQPGIARFLFQAGPYINYKFGGTINNTSINFDEQNINKLEYGYMFGMGPEIYNFQLSFKMKFALSSFYKNEIEPFGLMKNNSIMVSFGYFFN